MSESLPIVLNACCQGEGDDRFGCDYALLDLTEDLYQMILRRAQLLFAWHQTADGDIYEVQFWGDGGVRWYSHHALVLFGIQAGALALRSWVALPPADVPKVDPELTELATLTLRVYRTAAAAEDIRCEWTAQPHRTGIYVAAGPLRVGDLAQMLADARKKPPKQRKPSKQRKPKTK